MAEPRVIVVGAGPAGVRAAERLVEAGLRPTVVDEGRAAGGQIYRRQPENFSRPPKALYGFEADKAVALHGAFDAIKSKIDYRPNTLAWNVYDGALHIVRESRAEALPFDTLILAPGAVDRVLPLPGWTKPGVTSLGAAQIALKAQACAIGSRPVFVGTGPLLTLVAYQYAKAGVKPVVLDTSPFLGRVAALAALGARPAMLAKGVYYAGWLAAHGVIFKTGVTPLAIEGEGRGRAQAVGYRDGSGEHRIECDAVALGFGLRSETQLADLARCRFAFDPVARQWLPETDEDGRTSQKGVYLAGDGARIAGADAAELAGRLAAGAALADLGRPIHAAETERLRRALAPMARFRKGLDRAFPWPAHLARAIPDETLLCRCEAITAGELRRTARELGARELNRAKAFSRVGMGRCQGRYCGAAAAEVLSAALDVPVSEVGRIRGQAPVKPLPLVTEKVQ